MNREAIFCMLLYSRTEEKMTIKSTEMTLRLSAVPNVALAAGSRVLSAVQALSVLLATVKRNLQGFHHSFCPCPFPGGLFPGQRCSGTRCASVPHHQLLQHLAVMSPAKLSCLNCICFQRNMQFALKRGWPGLELTQHGCGNRSKSWARLVLWGRTGWSIPPCSGDLPPGEAHRGTALVSFLRVLKKKTNKQTKR